MMHYTVSEGSKVAGEGLRQAWKGSKHARAVPQHQRQRAIQRRSSGALFPLAGLLGLVDFKRNSFLFFFLFIWLAVTFTDCLAAG